MTNKILFLAILLFPVMLYSQSADNSPYSRFGFGNIVNSQKVSSVGMGRLSSVYGDGYNTNFDNPATLTSLINATYEGGIYAKYTQIEQQTSSQTQWSGNMSYLSISFPLKNQISESLQKKPSKFKWVMGFNLSPYSTNNYNLQETRNVDSIGEVQTLYNGTGGSYKMVWGNAVKYKNLSVGLNIGWLFGKSSYGRQILFNDLAYSYSDVFTDDYSIRGFSWKAGATYRFDLSQTNDKKEAKYPGRNLLIGVSGNSAQSFNTTQSFLYRRVRTGIQSPDGSTIDTFKISPAEGVKGKGKLPSELNVGVLYTHSPKLKIGVDYSFSDWSKYENDAKPSEQILKLDKQYKIAAGIEYSPNPDDYKYYFKRIRYRLGAYYQQDPRLINGSELTETGVSFGMGMPIRLPRQQIAFVHWALEAGKFGNVNVINEKYLRLHFAFNFSDTSWFYKRKYD